MQKRSLSSADVPKHIAIIMDGNRRWARARGLPDVVGHRQGSENLERIVEAAVKLEVKTLTVYALSTENLSERARREILALFALIETKFAAEAAKMAKNGVRVAVLGEIGELPKRLQKVIAEAKQVYIANEAIRLNIALNYGGRRELLVAIKKLVSGGVRLDKINEETLGNQLYTSGQSDPDLVIRTGGKVRLSNFLLWQTAYSELYFTRKLWPDFGPRDLKAAISWYQKQKRNFGK